MELKLEISQRRQAKAIKKTGELYERPASLYEELDRIGIIDRMKEIPQLGIIGVKRNFKFSKYDYMVLQLFFHKMIRKNDDINKSLTYTYNNYLHVNKLLGDAGVKSNERITIMELLQIFTIVQNIGHFYNTFITSKAIIMSSSMDEYFKDSILNLSSDKRFKENALKLIQNRDYQRYHLLNSLIILERCNQENLAVRIAKVLIYEYLEDNLNKEGKLNYVFEIFRCIRDVSYISFDLQATSVPLNIDLSNDKSLIVIFKELLSVYNDNRPIKELFSSINKLLSDTLYNNESKTVMHTLISKTISKKICNEKNWTKDDYFSLWLNKASILNQKVSRNKDYDENLYLKITFKNNERLYGFDLYDKLSIIQNVRVGYYNRKNNEFTIVVSINKKSDAKNFVALKVLKTVVSCLRKIKDIQPNDLRYLLVTKFFLYHVFNQHKSNFKTIIEDDFTVLCTKGHKKRINLVMSKIEKINDKNTRHEVEHLVKVLEEDKVNDVCIVVPASIIVENSEEKNKELCEFDGIIIYPNRQKEQLIFLEAKNIKEKKSTAKNCLCEKLDKLDLPYNVKDIITVRYDAYLKYNIN